MKTITNIQRILMLAGFITGLGLIDSIQTSYRDMWTGFVLIALVMIQLIRSQLMEELRKDK